IAATLHGWGSSWHHPDDATPRNCVAQRSLRGKPAMQDDELVDAKPFASGSETQHAIRPIGGEPEVVLSAPHTTRERCRIMSFDGAANHFFRNGRGFLIPNVR